MNSTHYCLNAPASNSTIGGLWIATPSDQLNFEGITCSTVYVTDVSNGTISTTFLGTQLTVAGGFQSSDEDSEPVLVYVLDGGLPSFIPLSAADGDQNGTIGTILQTPQLTYGLHTIDIVTEFSGQSSLVVDYIQIARPTTEKQLSSKPNSDDSSAASSSSSGTPTSAIAGGVVGGVVLLVGAMLAFYFMYWRRKHDGPGRYVGIPASEKDDEIFKITPLVLSQNSTPPVISPTRPPESRSVSSIVCPILDTRTSPTNSDDGCPTTTPRSRKVAEAEQQRSVRQHRDSGARFGNQPGPSEETRFHIPVEDVPPLYSES